MMADHNLTGGCTNMAGKVVSNGSTYVPGPDYCMVCKCDTGRATFCRAVLCQPRQDCKSFRIGSSCCDFICLDEVIPRRPDGAPASPDDENNLGAAEGSSAVSGMGTTLYDSILNLLASPYRLMLTVVAWLRGDGGPATARAPAPPPSSSQTSNRPMTARGTRGGARYRREGNIHRLGEGEDSDDESNTWNGNSTQQM